MHAGLRRYLDSVIAAYIINLCLPVHGRENVLHCRENWVFRECKFYVPIPVLTTVIYCRSSYRWIRKSEDDVLQITLRSWFTDQNSGYHVIKNCVFVDSGQSVRLTDNYFRSFDTGQHSFFLPGTFVNYHCERALRGLRLKKVIVHPWTAGNTLSYFNRMTLKPIVFRSVCANVAATVTENAAYRTMAVRWRYGWHDPYLSHRRRFYQTLLQYEHCIRRRGHAHYLVHK